MAFLSLTVAVRDPASHRGQDSPRKVLPRPFRPPALVLPHRSHKGPGWRVRGDRDIGAEVRGPCWLVAPLQDSQADFLGQAFEVGFAVSDLQGWIAGHAELSSCGSDGQ